MTGSGFNSGPLYSGLPLSRQKKSPTFPDEIAENISNKCTFINTKSACYELWGTFQQLTSQLKTLNIRHAKTLKVRIMYRYVLSMWPCTSHQCVTIKYPWLHKFPDFVPFPWPSQNSLTFPGLQKFQKSGNPVYCKPLIYSALRPTHPQTLEEMEMSSSLLTVSYGQRPNQQPSHNLRSRS